MNLYYIYVTENLPAWLWDMHQGVTAVDSYVELQPHKRKKMLHKLRAASGNPSWRMGLPWCGNYRLEHPLRPYRLRACGQRHSHAHGRPRNSSRIPLKRQTSPRAPWGMRKAPSWVVLKVWLKLYIIRTNPRQIWISVGDNYLIKNKKILYKSE